MGVHTLAIVIFFIGFSVPALAGPGDSLYTLLGVSEHATTSEIRTAYSRKVREVRVAAGPNTIGTMEKILDLRHALEILVDKNQRAVYDFYLSRREGIDASDPEHEQFERARERIVADFSDAILNRGSYGRLVSKADEDFRSNPEGAEILERVTRAFQLQSSSRTPFWIHRPYLYLSTMIPAPILGAAAFNKTGSAEIAALFSGAAALAGAIAVAQWEFTNSRSDRDGIASLYLGHLGFDPTQRDVRNFENTGPEAVLDEEGTPITDLPEIMTRALMAFDLWSARYFEKIVPSGSRDPKSEAFLYMKNSVLLGEKIPWLAQAVLIRYLTSAPNEFSSRQQFEYLFARRPNFWRDRAEDARQLLSQFPDLAPIGDKMLALRDKFASQPRWISPLQKIRTTCRTFLVNASSVQRSTPF